MQRMTRRLKLLYRKIRFLISSKIENRLMLFTAVMLFAVIGSITTISYFYLRSESVEQTVETAGNNLELVNKNYENYIKTAENYTLLNSAYDSFMSALTNEATDAASRSYLSDFLSSMYYSSDDIDSINLYVINDKVDYSISHQDYAGVNVNEGVDVTGAEWYRKALQNHGVITQPVFFSNSLNYMGKHNFMQSYRIYIPIGKTKPIAAIGISYNTLVTDEIKADIPLPEGEHFFYLGSNNDVFSTDDGSLDIFDRFKAAGYWKEVENAAQSGSFTCRMNNIRYLCVYDVAEDTGCRLVKLIPYRNIYGSATKTINLSLEIGSCMLLISIFLMLFISHAITKPIEVLSRSMAKFAKGELDVEKIEVSGCDEIAQLQKQFNWMVFKLNELINERYKIKIIEKNATLKALETEINPHFLYNALQVVSTKALKSGAMEVSDMVCALSRTFRYCIDGGSMVTISDELSHIKNYLYVQKMRFGSRLDIKYELDDGVFDAKIPKLSIQTLAENAVKHGLEKTEEKVTVEISVRRRDDGVRVSVTDDGPVVAPERFARLLLSIAKDEFSKVPDDGEKRSIGLNNLNSRLVILFGSDSKLHLVNGSSKFIVYFIVPQ